MVEATKKKSQKYYDIPPILGAIYYFTISGRNKSLICSAFNGKTVTLNSLENGFKFSWDLRHFSFMLRKCTWQVPSVNVGDQGEINVKITYGQQEKKKETYASLDRED